MLGHGDKDRLNGVDRTDIRKFKEAISIQRNERVSRLDDQFYTRIKIWEQKAISILKTKPENHHDKKQDFRLAKNTISLVNTK